MQLEQVPYLKQLDNTINPYGACNVTSVAMVLKFYKLARKDRYKRFTQFEDELYQYTLDYGLSRHDPQALAKLAIAYGAVDKFRFNSSIGLIKTSIAQGNPCIIHGYFTTFGHIVVVVGYDESGLIVHDPYGEYFADGYRTDRSGESIHYSYNLIERVCAPDNQFWCHHFSPPVKTKSVK